MKPKKIVTSHSVGDEIIVELSYEGYYPHAKLHTRDPNKALEFIREEQEYERRSREGIETQEGGYGEVGSLPTVET